VVFLSIILVAIHHIVSIENESGVTSNKSTSLTSQASTHHCIAAQSATTSSGLTHLCDDFQKKFSTAFHTAGILVIHQTRITSLISLVEIFASFRAFSTGLRDFFIRGSTRASSFCLENL